MNKICILSGRYPETKFSSSINQKIYADKYGYTYINCNWPTGVKNKYFNKIAYVRAYMDFFDYIVWIDDDAFFLDIDKDIMDYRPLKDEFLSICSSPDYKDIFTLISSGQFILKCNQLSTDFIDDVMTTDLKEVRKWWTSDKGFFSNGDQDAMVYLLHQEKYASYYKVYEYFHFNSRVENLETPYDILPLILHFTGKPEVKQENYRKAQKLLNRHPSLVETLTLEAYGVPLKKRITFKRILKRLGW